MRGEGSEMTGALDVGGKREVLLVGKCSGLFEFLLCWVNGRLSLEKKSDSSAFVMKLFSVQILFLFVFCLQSLAKKKFIKTPTKTTTTWCSHSPSVGWESVLYANVPSHIIYKLSYSPVCYFSCTLKLQWCLQIILFLITYNTYHYSLLSSRISVLLSHAILNEWLSHFCSMFWIIYPPKWCTYSAVCWTLHGWCHVEILPSWHTCHVHQTAMHQFTVSLYAKNLLKKVLLLSASAVTQGWNRVQNKSQHRARYSYKKYKACSTKNKSKNRRCMNGQQALIPREHFQHCSSQWDCHCQIPLTK